jgi:hypothetical protein
MQSSPALRELFERSMREMAAKNAQAILDMCSREPGVVFIGTAPNEWMESLAALEPVLRASLESGSGMMPAEIQIITGQEGSVGWAAAQWKVRLPNGSAIMLRSTNVCHLEGGEWRAVHTHLSVGVPDELIMNVAQPS